MATYIKKKKGKIQSKNLFIGKESSASNRNADSCAVLELYLVKFEKRLFFNSKMSFPVYSSLYGKWIVSSPKISPKNQKAPNFNTDSCAILGLYLFKLEERVFLTLKQHIPRYSSLHTQRI